MEYLKEITIKSIAWKCDFCDNEYVRDLHIRQPYIESCAMCEKHTCNDHVGQTSEDGILCIKCSKNYKIEQYEDGSVGVINKKTGKNVPNYL